MKTLVTVRVQMQTPLISGKAEIRNYVFDFAGANAATMAKDFVGKALKLKSVIYAEAQWPSMAYTSAIEAFSDLDFYEKMMR